MSAVRYGADRLRVTDADGDRLEFARELLTGSDVVVYVTMPGRGAVALDLDDVLAVLSFLSDAAGVERFVPAVDVAAGCAWCGQPDTAHPVTIRDASGQIAATCEEYVDASTAGGDRT